MAIPVGVPVGGASDKYGNTAGTVSTLPSAALTGTTCDYSSPKRTGHLLFTDGLSDRLLIDPNEELRLNLSLKNLRAGEWVEISAPNGGTLRREDGGPLRYRAQRGGENISLRFISSIGAGVYTIRLQQGGDSQIIGMWAGPLPQRGSPGPSYVAGKFPVEVP